MTIFYLFISFFEICDECGNLQLLLVDISFSVKKEETSQKQNLTSVCPLTRNTLNLKSEVVIHKYSQM